MHLLVTVDPCGEYFCLRITLAIATIYVVLCRDFLAAGYFCYHGARARCERNDGVSNIHSRCGRVAATFSRARLSALPREATGESFLSSQQNSVSAACSRLCTGLA